MTTYSDRKFLEAVTVIEKIDDTGRLRAQLEQDPGDHIAGVQLEKAYRSEGNWEGLVHLLLDRAETTEGPEAARILAEVAEIYSVRLSDPEAALVVLQTAFSRTPDSASLADSLCDLAYKMDRWAEVVDLFVIEAAKLSGRADAVASELWLRVAWAHLAARDDHEAAAAALERVSDLRSAAAIAIIERIEMHANTPALHRLLVTIARKLGDSNRELRALNRCLSASKAPADAVALHYEIASLHLERRELGTAEWHLMEVVRRDPSHTRALETLLDIYKDRGEFLKAAKLLETCKEHVANPMDRVALSFEAGKLYADALEEHTMAVDMFESALSIDPEHVGAALPLAERYYKEQRWAELEPLLDMLVRRAGALSGDAPMPYELFRRAGETAAKLVKFDKARRYYESALKLRGDDLESLVGLSEILLRTESWSDAGVALRTTLGIQERRGDREGACDTLMKMARCAEARSDLASAASAYQKVLSHRPGDRDAVRALGDILVKLGDFARAVEVKRGELAGASRERKVRLLAEIGNITSRQLRDPARAITIFQQALELDGDDREVRHQLVEHYSAAGWWQDAVECILHIARLEEQPIRKGKYLQAAGVMLRKEIGDIERAADCYDDALDCFYASGANIPASLREGCVKAFTDVGAMLSKAQKWKRLEQSYRRMIKRLDPADPLAADLWHGLGEIYRNHLGHRASAIGSFEIASALDDKRLTRHRILVDLYESAGPDKMLEAIERRHKLLDAEPLVADHYKALRKLYARTKQYDRAWCACRALSFLGQANEEEKAFLEARMPQGYSWPSGRVTEEMWRLVRDDGEDMNLTAIFALVGEEAAALSASQLKSLGLDERTPGTEAFRNLVTSVTAILGVEMPNVFVHPGAPGEVLWANAKNGKTLARTIAIGRDLYQGRDARYMVASIAKSLSYSRPAYLPRVVAGNAGELEAIFLAASSMSRRDVPVAPALVARVQTYRAHFESRLSSGVRSQLAAAVDRYVSAGRAYDLVAWSRSIDATSRRIALLVSGDLEATTVVGGGRLAGAESADLLRHSVSEGHFALRRHLGVARD